MTARFGPDGRIRFLQRGWANANSILIVGERPALIDTGHAADVDDLLTLLAAEGVAPEALGLIVNTHSHWDHTGGNAALRARSGAALAMSAQTAAWMAAGDRHNMWLSYFGVTAPLTTADCVLRPHTTVELGGLPFEVLALPGHAPDMIGFFQPQARLLVAADAVLPGGDCGILNIAVHGAEALDAAQATVAQVMALEPAVILPGHGAPIHDVVGNLATLQRRLRRFAEQPQRLVEHLARRVLLAYLLESAPLAIGDLVQRAAAAPWAQDYAPLVDRTPAALIETTLSVLMRARLVSMRDDLLVCHVAR